MADPAPHGRLSAAAAMLFGTLTVGVLDLLDAIVFFYYYLGVAPIRIPQSIAAGVLGRTAFQGGVQTAVLGTLLHFFIAFCVVSVFYLASRQVPFLVRHPWRCGALYGVMVYAFMNLVVIPLSASGGGGIPPLPIALNGILIHIFGVGFPSALFARAAR